MTVTVLRHWILLVVAVVVTGWLTALAAPPTKLSEVASTDDLMAEATARLSEIEQALASAESYRERLDSMRRSATHLAICAQALAEHDSDSKLKESGPDLRDAALAIAHSRSHAEASQSLAALKVAASGMASGTAKVEYDWSRLARLGSVMSAMKSRSESLRRAMRKPGDPAEDSRHATAIALLALVAHGDTHAVKDPADKPRWQELSLEVQRHFTKAATAIKARDESA
ncbi:MAG: hypothetical protein H7062_24635, partial [Candidatus Saccharimonas sp.]|nr:hypothetical protein [Planctomycetaceae bacterium]